jgi:hypothetical protein
MEEAGWIVGRGLDQAIKCSDNLDQESRQKDSLDNPELVLVDAFRRSRGCSTT